MYILITEDNEVFKTEILTDGDKAAVDDGILIAINLEDQTEYYDGKWTPIKNYTTPDHEAEIPSS